MTVTFFHVDPPPGGSTYSTPQELREALDVDETVLPDNQAEDILEDASVLIDGMLGARAVNPDTGRKVTETDVHSWQWDRLIRAVIKLACRLYEQPDLTSRQEFRKVSGPDFTTEGPIRTGRDVYGDDVIDLIHGSQLQVLSGRMV